MVKLTIKQKAFCDYYLISLNATEAAIKAGYSKKTAAVTGFENLRKPNIKGYLEQRLEKADKERIASADEVLEYLTRVIRGEEKEKTLLFDKETGESIEVDITPGLRERTKAAELLGKRYAIFTDKKEIDVNVNKSLEDFFGDGE